jgi:hypothetical protein
MSPTCKECGKQYARINNSHIVHTHHMTTDEYYEKYNLLPSKEYLEELYIDKCLSIVSISKITGCNNSSIYRLLLKYDIPRRTLSDASKVKIPIVHKEDYVCALSRPDVIEKNRLRMITTNPMKNPDVVNKCIQTRSDPEYRKAHSGINSPCHGRKPPKGSGIGNGSYYIDPVSGKRIWMYSTYEIKFANYLSRTGIIWEYAPKAFELSLINSSYRPDFYLPDLNMWIEVKGFWWFVSIEKMKLFNKIYSTENLRIFYKNDIKQIENSYNINDILKFGISVYDQCNLWNSGY